MNPSEAPPLPRPGETVLTACRGYIQYEPNIPTAIYAGRRVFFCLPTCLKAFEEDPKTSCLAGDLLMTDSS